MEELKSCPFCGNKAKFITTGTGYRNKCCIISFKIMCKECVCEISEAYGDIIFGLDGNGETIIEKDDREEAIKAWNRRAKSDREGNE